MKLFAVAGKPIYHSLSPALHNYLFAQYQIDACYVRLHSLNSDHLLRFADQIGISGLNITSPYKEEISKLVECDTDSKAIGAVNTVLFNNGKKLGFNTDVKGVSEPLKEYIDENIKFPNDIEVSILGSGGAAKSACFATTKKLGIRTNIIARNENDKDFFQNLGATFYNLNSDGSQKAFSNSKIIISTLPKDVLLPNQLTIRKEMVLFDAIYSHASKISEQFKKETEHFIDGKKWLVAQGISAFSHFTGIPENKINFPKDFPLTVKYNKSPIFITGMMGSGKTSLGTEFKNLGFKVCDLDKEIETRQQCSIAEIFNRKSEEHFRQIELETLKEVIKDRCEIIVCGGGTVANPNCIEVMKGHPIILLWAPIEVLANRLEKSADRPLLSGSGSLSESLNIIYQKRLKSYFTNSCLVMDSDSLDSAQIAAEIISELSLTRTAYD